MPKPLILSLLLSWSSCLYALHPIKIYFSGHSGFASPVIKFEGYPEQPITNKTFWGCIPSIQPFESTSIDVTWSWFSKYRISKTPGFSPIEEEEYKTTLVDITLKTRLYHLTSQVSLYAKYGIWALNNLHIVKRKLIFAPKREPSIVWGYGVVLGPSIKWGLTPRFSIDGAILYHFTLPNLPFLELNYVPHKFLLSRVSFTWQVW